MEKIKIQMNEIEGMTLKTETELNGYTFNELYEQLLLIAKSSPDIQLHSSAYASGLKQTPERFAMTNWKDDEECVGMVKIWTNEGKEALIKWFKDKKDMDLTQAEISKLSHLIAQIRAKFKQPTL